MSESEIPQDGAPDYESELARLRMRVAEAELRAEGARAGMRDLDALKMLSDEDRQAAAQDDGGAAKAVIKLRKEKPWLFTSSTSAAARAPAAAAAAAPVNAMTMSNEEWRTARAALLRKQGFRGS